MQENILIYPAVNRKSFMINFFLIIFAAISSFASWFCYTLVLDNYYLYSFITIPFILLFPFFFSHYLNSKIILGNNELIRKTLFRLKRIKYSDIKTFKRFETIASDFGATHIDSTKSNSLSFLSIRQVYVSTKEKSNPNDFKKGKNLLFNDTKDVYQKLKDKITAANIEPPLGVDSVYTFLSTESPDSESMVHLL